jgi:hypothetical protein
MCPAFLGTNLTWVIMIHGLRFSTIGIYRVDPKVAFERKHLRNNIFDSKIAAFSDPLKHTLPGRRKVEDVKFCSVQTGWHPKAFVEDFGISLLSYSWVTSRTYCST